jgi:hypothetical protein
MLLPDCRLDYRGISFTFPEETKDFSLLCVVKTGFAAHPSSHRVNVTAVTVHSVECVGPSRTPRFNSVQNKIYLTRISELHDEGQEFFSRPGLQNTRKYTLPLISPRTEKIKNPIIIYSLTFFL